MSKHKLIVATLLAVLLLALVVGVGMAKKYPPPGISTRPCTSGIQAGSVELQQINDIEPVKVWISFNTPFCQSPVVVATAGENTRAVCVVEVSNNGAWLEFENMGGSFMRVYWQATVPTQ